MPGKEFSLGYEFTGIQFSRSGLTSLLNYLEVRTRWFISKGLGTFGISDGVHTGRIVSERNGYGIDIGSRQGPQHPSLINWIELAVILDLIGYCESEHGERTGIQDFIKQNAVAIGEVKTYRIG